MSLLKFMIDNYGGLQQVLSDPKRKGLGQMVREATDVVRRTGAAPEWYFLNFAYRRDTGDYTHYLYREQYQDLMGKLRRRENFNILEDKLQFHERLGALGFGLPPLLAYNRGKAFLVDGKERHVDDERAFVALVDELLSRSATGSIFAKPVDGGHGRGCRRINAADTNLVDLYAETLTSSYLFEETLVQHPMLSAISPHSVNTLRVLTCNEPGEPAAAIAAILRLGVGGSAVDNASQGGIFVGLELATGRLFPQARRLFKHGGDVYTAHPDTDVRFERAQVPYYPEVLAAAEAAATHVPHDLTGWDIAVTEAGPIIIEGNALPHMPMMEIALGQGMLAYPCVHRLCQRMLGEA